MKRYWWQIAFIVMIALVGLHSCNTSDMPDTVVATNNTFTLTGDSLTMGDTVIYAPAALTLASNIKDSAGNPLTLKLKDNSATTHLTSKHSLVNALSAMSWQIVNDRNNLHFDSSNDLYDAIELALACVDPDLSMRLLKDLVKDSVVVGNESPYYPAYNNRLAWPAAAWTVYQVTGDKKWLKYAYTVATNTLKQEEDIAFYTRDWLVRGCSTDYTPLVDALPAWMESSDVFSTFTLSNNIETARSLAVIAEMADELELDAERFNQMSRDLISAVNEELWNEKHGQYSALIYGQTCTLHAPCSDNRAQALTVLWGMADEDDRASTLIAKTAVTHCGVNNFFPAYNQSEEPCLTEMSWGLTQGLWNLASAHVGNDNALRRGLAALWRAQALYSTLFVNAGSASLDVYTAISNVAMTVRLIAGIEFEPNGINFSPTIPQCLSGDKTIHNLKYRNGMLDITVKGTGHDVDYIMLDNVKQSGSFIASKDLRGHHEVVVVMTGDSPQSHNVTIANQRTVLPDVPVVTWIGDSAVINNYDPTLTYHLVIDGSMSYSVSDSVFALPVIDNFSEVALAAANKRCFSYTSRPFILGGDLFQLYTLPSNMANHDTVSVNINVPQAGDYMLSVGYLSSTHCGDVRIVGANTHRQGVVSLSGLNSEGVSGHSNLIHVDLLRNTNVIQLIKAPSMKRTATPISINLFKKH